LGIILMPIVDRHPLLVLLVQLSLLGNHGSILNQR
jgi:hypothetical protein